MLYKSNQKVQYLHILSRSCPFKTLSMDCLQFAIFFMMSARDGWPLNAMIDTYNLMGKQGIVDSLKQPSNPENFDFVNNPNSRHFWVV